MDPEPLQVEHQRRTDKQPERVQLEHIGVFFHADILLQRVGEPGDGWGWAEWDDG